MKNISNEIFKMNPIKQAAFIALMFASFFVIIGFWLVVSFTYIWPFFAPVAIMIVWVYNIKKEHKK